MRESIIQNEERCFLCGTAYGLEHHHVWHGINRAKADADGLWVYLCRRCHAALHERGEYDELLMQEGEIHWLIFYGGTKDDFRKRYGKNVL